MSSANSLLYGATAAPSADLADAVYGERQRVRVAAILAEAEKGKWARVARQIRPYRRSLAEQVPPPALAALRRGLAELQLAKRRRLVNDESEKRYGENETEHAERKGLIELGVEEALISIELMIAQICSERLSGRALDDLDPIVALAAVAGPSSLTSGASRRIEKDLGWALAGRSAVRRGRGRRMIFSAGLLYRSCGYQSKGRLRRLLNVRLGSKIWWFDRGMGASRAAHETLTKVTPKKLLATEPKVLRKRFERSESLQRELFLHGALLSGQVGDLHALVDGMRPAVEQHLVTEIYREALALDRDEFTFGQLDGLAKRMFKRTGVMPSPLDDQELHQYLERIFTANRKGLFPSANAELVKVLDQEPS